MKNAAPPYRPLSDNLDQRVLFLTPLSPGTLTNTPLALSPHTPLALSPHTPSGLAFIPLGSRSLSSLPDVHLSQHG
ncbi:hypothetical protein Pmani_022044 [Petrolisthes manimaculis]|uniref:Uncharacterized protein n=1 Tax=Petrolisthes manimaculis TaxID=1843537 RepID=A0AAE1U4N9_9EUCA|nr:hypothetical protein Pmani_022044 [Petrolisthes manimaculis]